MHRDHKKSDMTEHARTHIEVSEAHLVASFTYVLPHHGLSFHTLSLYVARFYLIKLGTSSVLRKCYVELR